MSKKSQLLSPSVLVSEGRDDWLFLTGGSNNVASLYTNDGPLPISKLSLWRQLIEKRTARCHAYGIHCLHIVVPDKLTIYGDQQLRQEVDADLSPATRLAKLLKSSPAQNEFLDLTAPMRARAADKDLYWHTDSHWTPEGCFLGYALLCERLGLKPVEDLLARPFQTYDAIMDLGAWMQPPRWEKVRKYNFLRDAQRSWINSVTRYLEDPLYNEAVHVGARARFVNPVAPNRQSVLLFGDSYSHPSSHGLSAMLAETVQSIEFIWSSGIDWRLVRRRRPKIVIVEIAERFLALLAHDSKPLWLLELQQAARARRIRNSVKAGAKTD